MTRCRYCPARLDFVRTPAGRHMPVRPETFATRWVVGSLVDGGAKLTLVQTDGTVLTCWEATPETPGAVQRQGWISHFADCPGRDQARRKKGATA